MALSRQRSGPNRLLERPTDCRSGGRLWSASLKSRLVCPVSATQCVIELCFAYRARTASHARAQASGQSRSRCFLRDLSRYFINPIHAKSRVLHKPTLLCGGQGCPHRLDFARAHSLLAQMTQRLIVVRLAMSRKSFAEALYPRNYLMSYGLH